MIIKIKIIKQKFKKQEVDKIAKQKHDFVN